MNQIQILWILATCAATSMFAMFCFTVRSFPGGGIRIEGPGGIRLEAQLGNQPLSDKALPKGNHK